LLTASGAVLTCKAIVSATIGLGVDEEDRKTTWSNDAEQLVGKGSIETARAVFQHMLTHFRSKKSVWLKAAQLEKQYEPLSPARIRWVFMLSA